MGSLLDEDDFSANEPRGWLQRLEERIGADRSVVGRPQNPGSERDKPC